MADRISGVRGFIARLRGAMLGKKPSAPALIPIAEHERVRRKKMLMTRALVNIAAEMNRLADELHKENSSISEETQPAPLGD